MTYGDSNRLAATLLAQPDAVTVQLHRQTGTASAGGSVVPAFADPETVTVRIRPGSVEPYTVTPTGTATEAGRDYWLLADPADGIGEGDRIYYGGAPYRVSGPNVDQAPGTALGVYTLNGDER